MKTIKTFINSGFAGKFMAMFALLTFSACSTSGSYNVTLAPLPPGHSEMAASGHGSPMTGQQANRITPAAGKKTYRETARQERAVLAVGTRSAPDCSVKDRFDRDALFAYEFGTQGRNRVAFDVDGLNMDSTEIEEVKISFTYRLQADRPRKERCRYKSNYQGLIGSGYNEMVQRDSGHTVWHEIRDARYEIEDRLGI